MFLSWNFDNSYKAILNEKYKKQKAFTFCYAVLHIWIILVIPLYMYGHPEMRRSVWTYVVMVASLQTMNINECLALVAFHLALYLTSTLSTMDSLPWSYWHVYISVTKIMRYIVQEYFKTAAPFNVLCSTMNCCEVTVRKLDHDLMYGVNAMIWKRFPNYWPFGGNSLMTGRSELMMGSGIRLGISPANGRPRYIVTTSLIGCVYT